MPEEITISRELYDHFVPERVLLKSREGLDEKTAMLISQQKSEPGWMLEKRLKALQAFQSMQVPEWGPDLSNLDLGKIVYYRRPDAKRDSKSWEEVPEDIKQTFEKLGIPEAERKVLGGAGAQFESEVVYHRLREDLEKKGVVFENMDTALQSHPDIVKEYFMTKCVPPNDHKFAALHGAVWSGGTFIYVPKGIKVDVPLQAYFRMNAEKGGQFEHTLIIVDEGADLHYIEGCSAPQYASNSIHAGCVEIYVKKNARCRYTSIENWSKNTYNLNTKRAIVEEDGVIEWINVNTGSGVTMLYPCSILKGDRSRTDSIGVAFAGEGQNQDTGMKVIHIGKDTKSNIIAKSISRDGGITTYRGLLKIMKGAKGAKSNVSCDALMIDPRSVSNTIPYIDIQENDVHIGHEATVGKVSREQIFYLMSRGLSEQEATKMIVSGFVEPVTKQLPLEYAVEFNRLIELEMEGSVG